MSKHKQIEKCQTCGRATNNAYICRRCANELQDLLIGSRESDGQPGIIWYVKRLRESAYGQTRMARSLAARSSNQGYALLGNRRAVDLLARINGTLAVWEGIAEALSATHSHELGFLHMGSPTKDFERLEAKRARYIGARVLLIRHHCPDAHRLHSVLLEYAREAWRIINRPDDICCGPCPNMIQDRTEIVDAGDQVIRTVRGKLKRCGTLLYAEEGSGGVRCPGCHAHHDVEQLREGLKAYVTDMLFTRSDLVNLMETRLNDRIPQPTFTKLLRDGRLQPRRYEEQINAKGECFAVPLFTYDDVVAARLKPVPHKRIKVTT